MTDAAAAAASEPRRGSAALQRLRGSFHAVGAVAANPALRRVQLALVGSETGNWMGTIALSIVSFKQAGLTGFGLVYGLRMALPALAAPFLGLLGDRLPRRRVMAGADLSRVLLVGSASAILYLGGSQIAVYVLFAFVTVAGTAFRPAQAALLPTLARSPDELTAANAVATTIQSAASFVGPAVGGILAAATQPATALAVAAGAFVWSAALLLGVREPPREPDGGSLASVRAIGAQLAGGVRVLVGERTVTLLVGLIAAQVVVYGALLVFLAGLSFNVLHGGDRQFGVLFSALGIGGLIGAAGSVGLIGTRLTRSFAVATALWGAPIALLAVWQSRAGAFVLVAAIGLANTFVDVAAYTLMQRAIPAEALGRVFGLFESVIYGAVLLGAVVAPALVSWVGLDTTLVATGVFLPAVVTASWPLLRRLEPRAGPAPERIALLRGVPFLALLPEPSLEHLAEVLVPVHAKAGEALVRQGEPGDRFFIVAEGEVVVEIDGATVQRGGRGYYFGEIALLRNEPRSATVSALAGAELLALERGEFLATVTGHADSAAEADAVISARLGIARPALFGV